jgi:hypothetical protein
MACSTHGKKRKSYRILVRNPEGKRTLGKSGRKCEDNMKIYLREIRLGDRDWICPPQVWISGALL